MNFSPSFYSWSRVKKYERHIASGALFLGFVVDTITLARVDTWLANGILLFYLFASGIFILIANAGERRFFQSPFFARLVASAPFFIQFSFGALFSGFLVLYGRSASLSATAIFVVILSALFFGNELLRKHYARAIFQVVVLYFALFSFLIFFIPIVVGRMGPEMFLLSGAISIVIARLFLSVLRRVSPARAGERRKLMVASIAGMFIVMNGLYFWNIIPPLPLSVKEAGIYYSVRKTEQGYIVRSEARPMVRLPRLFEKVNIGGEDTLFAWSAVFAPSRLSISVVHVWQHYDEGAKEWKTTDRIGFSVTGGREGGYRGYTLKEGVYPGKWRVNVETPQGQLIGRIRFEAVDAPAGRYEVEMK